MSQPSVAIAVISHEQTKLVENLLASLTVFRPEVDFHVYVLENVQGQPAIQPEDYEFPVTYWQNETPFSLSENINQVYRKTQGQYDYYCILNPDILFIEQVFISLIAVMQEHDIQLVAPLIVDSNGKMQDSFRTVPRPLEIVLRYLKLSRPINSPEDLPPVFYPEWIGAMFMLMPSSVFEKVGGFDPNYRLYFEDVDFCVRLRQHGMRIGVVRDVHVVHDAQRASHHKLSYLFKHLRSAIRFFRSDVYRQSRL